MHEMAVTQSILEIALDHAGRAGAARVTALNLVIGQLSSIVDDSVQFYWDIISKDTLCEGATLIFERVAAEMNCLDCGHTYTLSRGLEACPHCGGFRVRVAAGEEFRLESIEVETDSARGKSPIRNPQGQISEE
jgi:hydrogenase nickel incorporation protein HypA/HybF